MKRRLLTMLTHDTLAPLFLPLQGGRTSIFFFHRFGGEGGSAHGHDPAVLRRQLEYLRRHRVDVLPLLDVVEGLHEGRAPARPSVVLTVDDGYDDFARVAAPVFAEFDCPVTVFLATGFVDRELWMWWDKIWYAFEHTRRTAVTLELGGVPLPLALGDAPARRAVAAGLIERVKTLAEADRLALVARWAELLEVTLPAAAPAGCTAMTWDDVARCAAAGVTFGPHTVTHPILSRTPDAQSAHELRESWRRLRAHGAGVVPVFAYPNGDPASFGEREQRTLAAMGLRGAVTTVQEWTAADTITGHRPFGAYAIPRFPYPDDEAQFRQIVGGIERGKRLVRRALARA